MSVGHQRFAYYEVFSPQGNKPLPFKVLHSKGVRREFDKGLKGSILTIEGVTTQTKVQIPKDDKVSLQLTHPYLVLQVFALQGQPLYLEIIVTDVECSGKFRLIFSSSVKETVHTAHHTKLPLNGIIWNKWLNLCFHMPQLIFDNFKQLVVRTTDAIILGPCRLRKIFTMRDVRDGIPTAMDFPPGTDHQSLLFCTNPTANDPSRPVSHPSDCVMTAQRRSLTSPPLPAEDSSPADLRICSSDSNRSSSTQQSTPAHDPGTSVCSSAGSQPDGAPGSLWPAGALTAAGVRPLERPRGSSGESCLSTPILKDPLEGSLFGFPRVKLTFEKKDSLEQLLTRTPKPKRLPALRVRTVNSPPSIGEDSEKYVTEPTSKSPWRMDREHKRVTFSASTKLEDGCSWSHLIESPCTYDSLDMACEEELSYRSDEDDPEEEQSPFACTVRPTRASDLLDQAAAAVAQAAKESPTRVSGRAPPGLAHLTRLRSPVLSSTSDLSSPETPARPLSFPLDDGDHAPPVIHSLLSHARSPKAPAPGSPSSSSAGSMAFDRLRAFAPARYAPLQPLSVDPRPDRLLLTTPLSMPASVVVSPSSRPLRLTTPRSYSLPSTPTRRVVDQDLLPLCRTSQASKLSP
eukprot:EG_transcript_6458